MMENAATLQMQWVLMAKEGLRRFRVLFLEKLTVDAFFEILAFFMIDQWCVESANSFDQRCANGSS